MNKEAVSIKITTPLFEKTELDLLNNYNETMHDLITEYTKMYLEDKDKVITQRIIICQQEKIDQLTNNWNELEEWLKNEIERFKEIAVNQGLFIDKELSIRLNARIKLIENILDKMKEIKEGNNV